MGFQGSDSRTLVGCADIAFAQPIVPPPPPSQWILVVLLLCYVVVGAWMYYPEELLWVVGMSVIGFILLLEALIPGITSLLRWIIITQLNLGDWLEHLVNCRKSLIFIMDLPAWECIVVHRAKFESWIDVVSCPQLVFDLPCGVTPAYDCWIWHLFPYL